MAAFFIKRKIWINLIHEEWAYISSIGLKKPKNTNHAQEKKNSAQNIYKKFGRNVENLNSVFDSSTTNSNNSVVLSLE